MPFVDLPAMVAKKTVLILQCLQRIGLSGIVNKDFVIGYY